MYEFIFALRQIFDMNNHNFVELLKFWSEQRNVLIETKF